VITNNEIICELSKLINKLYIIKVINNLSLFSFFFKKTNITCYSLFDKICFGKI